MNQEQAEQKLIYDSILIPPMEPFIPIHAAASDAARALLVNCGLMAQGAKDDFYRWLAIAVSEGRQPFAFYGSALRGSSSPTDVDILVFRGRGNLPIFQYMPDFIHPTDSAAIEVSAQLVASSMLFPANPSPAIIAMVEDARQRILRSDFFDGGVGDLLIYAAYKALMAGPKSFTERQWPLVRNVTLDVSWRWVDTANMKNETSSSHEISSQLREQMASLEPCQLAAMAKAAIYRMNVKPEQRKQLADKFVAGLIGR